MAQATKRIITSKVKATASGQVASIRIIDYIGEWTDSGSRSIRYHVDAMLREGVNDAEIYINSRGGNVFEATEIVNELRRFKNVTIAVGALAASAATYITSKFKTTANSSSQLMIHRPMLNSAGDVNQIAADLKLLENITADYKSTYAKKTGKTEDEIEALWSKGDYWMTAEEALQNHFIDEISDKEEAVSDSDVELLVACGAPKVPERKVNAGSWGHEPGQKNVKNILSNMERDEIIAALGLAADATDEQIKARAKELKLKAGSYDTLLAENKATAQKRAKTLVAEAVNAKKITTEESEKYEQMAVTDYDFVAGVFAKMGTTPRLSGMLHPGGGADNARANWTMDDYLEKDPEALEKLYEEDPEKVKELEKNYFKK